MYASVSRPPGDGQDDGMLKNPIYDSVEQQQQPKKKPPPPIKPKPQVGSLTAKFIHSHFALCLKCQLLETYPSGDDSKVRQSSSDYILHCAKDKLQDLSWG